MYNLKNITDNEAVLVCVTENRVFRISRYNKVMFWDTNTDNFISYDKNTDKFDIIKIINFEDYELIYCAETFNHLYGQDLIKDNSKYLKYLTEKYKIVGLLKFYNHNNSEIFDYVATVLYNDLCKENNNTI